MPYFELVVGEATCRIDADTAEDVVTILRAWQSDKQEMAGTVKIDTGAGATASPAPEPDGGWIEWHGGSCPVKGDTFVDVRFINGGESLKSRAYIWTWRDIVLPIVAYRISRP